MILSGELHQLQVLDDPNVAYTSILGEFHLDKGYTLLSFTSMVSRICDVAQSTKHLCERCRNIPAETFYSSGIGSEYRPTESHQLIGGSYALDELKRAAESGCELCTLFEDALRLCDYDPWEQLRRQPEYCDEGLILSHCFSNRQCITLTFGLYSHFDLEVRISVEKNGKDSEVLFPSWVGRPGSYPIEPSPDTSSSFALVRSWLAECVSSHTECAVTARTRFPRRLIDIGQESIRLVLTNDLHRLGEDVHYVALSYCWGELGSTPPPKTTRETANKIEPVLRP